MRTWIAALALTFFSASSLALSAAWGQSTETTSGPSLESIQASLGDDAPSLAGYAVYVDFWASWCGPCRQSLPWLQLTAGELEERGLRVVTVNLDRDSEKGVEFAKAHGIDLQTIFDPEGRLAKQFEIEVMPTAFAFDRSGALSFRHEGFRKSSAPELFQALEQLVAVEEAVE